MNLLSVQGNGALFFVMLLLICVIVVHAAKLIYLGYRTLGKKAPKKAKKPAEPPEPVYYIVERKKKRAKAEYDEPRRIQFK